MSRQQSAYLSLTLVQQVDVIVSPVTLYWRSSLLVQYLPSQTIVRTVSSELLGFRFFSFPHFFRFWAVRYNKPAISSAVKRT